MNGYFLRILALMLIALGSVKADVRAVMSSQFLVRGEQVIFEIRVAGMEPDRIPTIPAIKDVTVESLGFGRPNIYPGRRIESSIQYVVSSYKVGKHEIPAIDVLVRGKRYTTTPVPFEVFDPNELEWKEAETRPRGETIRYATVLKVPERKYFENQAMPTEIKVFIPNEVARTVADWGIPEFERQGLAVWRFEPSPTRGQVNLLGQPYVTRSYPTTMTALETGMVEIGPATVRLTYTKMIFDRFAQRINVEAMLNVDKLEFEVHELPEGAPAGYDNAVGDFTIEASLQQDEVTEGEPLAVDVVVKGTGNLDNLRSPKMSDENGWKVYDATPTQRGDERRDLTGQISFSQFIRPLEMKTGIPPFKLVFFNPDTETYETVTTQAIPVDMTPAVGVKNFESSGPPPALPMPVERMTDILGLVQGAPLLSKGGIAFPWWITHVIGGLLAALLIIRSLWSRYAHLLEKDPDTVQRRKDLQQVSQVSPDEGVKFLRAAGAFVEKWLSTEENEEIQEILEERDRLCFRPSESKVELPRRRRDEILKRLRKAALALAVTAFSGFFLQTAQGQEIAADAMEAYESAKFEQAAQLWLDAGPYEQLSADTLYNIGNAAYRMGEAGQAALYYRRALARDATHGESQQNLRFIERKYGSISVDRPDYQYVLAKIPLSVWKGVLWIGLWVVVLSLLVFPATRYGSRWRVAGMIGFVVGPLLISFGALGSYYYPDDANYVSLENQAVIVGANAVLHSDAARTAPEVIDAPLGSLVEVLKRSERWAYVSFATQTRGWVLMESIEMVIPDEKPTPPKVRKSSGTGNSA